MRPWFDANRVEICESEAANRRLAILGLFAEQFKGPPEDYSEQMGGVKAASRSARDRSIGSASADKLLPSRLLGNTDLG